jgi:hypothetical protein
VADIAVAVVVVVIVVLVVAVIATSMAGWSSRFWRKTSPRCCGSGTVSASTLGSISLPRAVSTTWHGLRTV